MSTSYFEIVILKPTITSQTGQLWGTVCVKTPILANIYETHRCLLNIASLIPYLVNISTPMLATSMRYLANIASECMDAMFSKHRLHAIFAKTSPRDARMRCLANTDSKYTHAIFTQHRLHMRQSDI